MQLPIARQQRWRAQLVLVPVLGQGTMSTIEDRRQDALDEMADDAEYAVHESQHEDRDSDCRFCQQEVEDDRVDEQAKAPKPISRVVLYDLEEASRDNLETYEDLWRYPKELRSAGIAQERCEHWHDAEDDECRMPLVISEYGSWFGRATSPLYFGCECLAGS